MDITNIALASDKITVTMADGTMQDFTVSAATPMQTVEVHTGDIIEIKGV